MKTQKKLALKKSLISNLDRQNMASIRGGDSWWLIDQIRLSLNTMCTLTGPESIHAIMNSDIDVSCTLRPV